MQCCPLPQGNANTELSTSEKSHLHGYLMTRQSHPPY